MKKLILIPVLFLFGCATGSLGGAQFQLRPYQEVKMENGMTLLLIQDTSLPRISMSMLVKVGSAQDPAGQEGVNALVAGLLDQGTATRSAPQLAEEFNQLGTEVSQSTGHDYTTVSVSGLSTTKDQLLDLYSDVVMNPAFAQAEVNREKSQTVAQLKKLIDQPHSYADILLAKEVYGAHPYSRVSGGTIQTVQSLTRSDLVRHYFKFYRPNNSILAITGNFDNTFVTKVKTTFAKWQSKPIESLSSPKMETISAGKIKLISKADLKQTQIRWGQIGLRRADPDFLKIRLASVILGGTFASRLMQQVRDDKGLTYSISSSSEALLQPGEFEISTFTRNEKASETIQETRRVVKEFVKDGITRQELDSAKALLIGQFPSALETTDKLAMNLMLLRLYQVPDDYLHSFHKLVNSITVDEVNDAIRNHINPDKMVLVVYADKKAVETQLRSLGDVNVQDVSR